MAPRNKKEMSPETPEERAQKKIDWEMIIFVPFNKYFRGVLGVSIMFTIFTTIFQVGYENMECTWMTAGTIFAELIFGFDAVLRFMHSVWKRVSSQRMFVAKHSYWFFVDVSALVPLDVMLSSQVSERNLPFLKLNRLLRVHRLVNIFEDFNNDLLLNRIVFVYITHLFTLLGIVQILSTILFYLGCWKCPHANWSQELGLEFDPLDTMHWYLICFTMTIGLVTRNWRGIVRGETPSERIIITIYMLGGIIFEYGACIGRLISVYMKQRQRQMEFELDLEMIRRVLFIRDIDKVLQANILQYYNYLWKRRLGFKSIPYTDGMPLSMQKEINLDIFWDTCQHCQYIRELDVAFRRSLCLNMKTEFFLPGEYVLRRGEMTDKIMYVVSGVLQILSEEEGESAVFSLSGGTCIGEFCLLLPQASKIDIRSATYCEIQTLCNKDFASTYNKYPGMTSRLFSIYLRRIEVAKAKIGLKEIVNETGEEKGTEEIKWIKKQWKRAIEVRDEDVLKREDGDDEEEEEEEMEDIDTLLLAQHTSEYLKSLVFSEKIELKTEAIFIKPRFPWVLNPDSSFFKFWTILVFISNTITFLIFPYYIAFKGEFPHEIEALSTWVTVTYIADVYIKCTTAIKSSNTITTSFTEIFHIKARQFLFICDLIAAIPIEIPFRLFNASKYTIAFTRCNRLMKVFSVVNALYTWGGTLNARIILIRTITHVFIYGLTIYISSAVVYMTACPQGPNEMCHTYSWFAMGLFKEVETTNNLVRFKNSFVVSIAYVMSCIMKFGFSTEFPIGMIDIIMILLLTIIAYFLYDYFFAEYCSIEMLIRKKRIGFKDLIIDLKEHMHNCNVDMYTRDKVFRYMYFQWDHNFATSVLRGERSLFKHANPVTINLVLNESLENAISHIILFRDTDPRFLRAIASRSKLYALGIDAIVTESLVRSTSLNIIRKGYCIIQSHLPGDVERKGQNILGPGSHFPVVEFFHQVPSFVTVKTITHCEVVTIEFEQMQEVLNTYSAIREEIEDTVKEQEQLQMVSKLKASKQTIWTIGRADMYSVNYLEAESDREKEDYIRHWGKYKSFSIIRMLLFRKTIDPSSTMLLKWEIARSIFAILAAISVPLHYSALVDLSGYFIYFHWALDLTAWADIYFRLHVAYYNEKNILVRHVLCTARYYLTHAFILDLVGSLPLPLLEAAASLLKVSSLYRTQIILVTLSRLVQMYRFYYLCAFLEGDALKDRRYLTILKHWITALILINIVACITPCLYCRYKRVDNRTLVTDCVDELGIIEDASKYANIGSPIVMYVVALYYTVCMFTLNSDGTMEATTIRAQIILCLIAAIIFFIRAMFVAVVAGLTMLGNVRMTKYQERMKSLIRFLKSEGADTELTTMAIQHFEYEWSCSLGSSRQQIFSTLHPTLRETVCFNIYSKILKKVTVFRGAEESFIRQISSHVKEIFFVKGEHIIRSCDVIGEIYFTFKGMLETVDENGERVVSLLPGSVFGNLCKIVRRRLRIDVVAKSNVTLLCIETNVFYKIIQRYPIVAERFRKEVLLHPEAMEIHASAKGSEVSFETRSATSFLRIKYKVIYLLTEENKVYEAWKAFVCLIAAYASVILTIINMTIRLDDYSYTASIALYCLDAIFVIKLILGFISPYQNKETGLYVYDYKDIAIRYLKAYDGCFLDLASLVPLEAIAIVYARQIMIIERNWTYWLKCNRLLRLFMIVFYFRAKFNKLNIIMLFRWIKVTMEQSLAIVLGGGVFILFCCHLHFCKYRRETMADSEDLITTTNGVQMMAVVGLYIMSLFTSSSFQLISPHTIEDGLVTATIMLVFQHCIAVLIGDIVSIISIKNYSRNIYENEVEIILAYAKDVNLSPALLKQIGDYAAALWNTNFGERLPYYIVYAPKSLQETLKGDMYGHHLHKNPYLSGLHMDFLRQLVGCLERSVYFPGNVIIQKGDVDNSVYFINDGEVEVVQTIEYSETVIDVLTQNDAFGIMQGFLGSTAHENDYRARTIVEILSLNRENWEYLLDYFPDCKTEIYSRIQFTEPEPSS